MPPAGLLEPAAFVRCNRFVQEKSEIPDYDLGRLAAIRKEMNSKEGIEKQERANNMTPKTQGETRSTTVSALRDPRSAPNGSEAVSHNLSSGADKHWQGIVHSHLGADRAKFLALAEAQQQQRHLLAIETEQLLALQQQEQLALLQQSQQMPELGSLYQASSAGFLGDLERSRQQQALLASSMHAMAYPRLVAGPGLLTSHHLSPLAAGLQPTSIQLANQGLHHATTVPLHTAFAASSEYLRAAALQGHADTVASAASSQALREQARKYANTAKARPAVSLHLQHPTNATSRLIERYSSGGTKEPPFPLKLHAILANPKYEDLIVWLPSGRSWRILNPLAFEKTVIPHFFRHAKYASFMRQVNGWGFKRTLQGMEHNSYCHELFVRDDPERCLKMKRVGATRNAAGEPVTFEPASDDDQDQQGGEKSSRKTPKREATAVQKTTANDEDQESPKGKTNDDQGGEELHGM